jgi:hypothetical protein
VRSPLFSALAALLLSPIPALSAPPSIPPGHARPGHYQVIKTYLEGPWVVPTLEAVRSADESNNQMNRWWLEQKVVGKEAPPDINWSHQAVIVLSLGKQLGQCDVDVNHCTVFADTTLFDLHFVTPTQWDPNADVLHPAVLIAVDRADLKNLLVHYDCLIDGLPNGQGRRGNGVGISAGIAPTSDLPSVEAVNASFDANTTWGRVKDTYRR